MPLSIDVQGLAEELRRAFRDEDDAGRPGSTADWLPPTDVIERPDGLAVSIDLAGVGGRLRVAVIDRTLVVSGEHSLRP